MYKNIEPLIENTICEKREKGGKTLSYRIRPAEGYKLHEITLDEIDENEEKINKGFTKSYITAGADYDFKENKREIYAVKEESE